MRARSSFCGLLSIRKALLLAQVIGQSIKEPGAIEIKAVKEDSGGRESTPAKVVIATRRVQSPARCTNRSKRVKSDWFRRENCNSGGLRFKGTGESFFKTRQRRHWLRRLCSEQRIPACKRRYTSAHPETTTVRLLLQASL